MAIKHILIDILSKQIQRNPLRSQREACAVAARRSIAAFGPANSEKEIKDICIALASGLFGDAFSESTVEQDRMIALMEGEYRKCNPGYD